MLLKQSFTVGTIPALLWGEPSEKGYLYVHGKEASKESAEAFAKCAERQGYQVLSFDLPRHGDRKGQEKPCDLWNGMRDLLLMEAYASVKWRSLSLFACSLGAFFSLHAFPGRRFENCLFLSPVVDMDYLMAQMFSWFHITEDALREKGTIETPVDTMSWEYYQYVREHPVQKWNSPTHILYGAKDALQSRAVIEAFARSFRCRLTVSETSDHPFMSPEDAAVAEAWMEKSLSR